MNEKQKGLHQTFLQAKTFTKKMLTLSAAETVGKNLKQGATVVLESTVYPGVTEEIVKHVLERESKMNCGIDFYIGYSPERINPGDETHALTKITKIVAGMNDDTTEVLAELYGLITNVYKAKEHGYDVIVVDNGSEDGALKRYIRK